jgi:cytidine deaminase
LSIELDLYRAAADLISQRYPEGWGGAAVMRTSAGKLLTSVAPETKNDALALCMETGACLEAHKLNEAVTHSLCMFRENPTAPFTILSPCGICQERLMHWGDEVRVAVSTPGNTLVFRPLREFMTNFSSQA